MLSCKGVNTPLFITWATSKVNEADWPIAQNVDIFWFLQRADLRMLLPELTIYRKFRLPLLMQTTGCCRSSL